MYKNAKTKVTQKGTSAMQRVGNDSQSNPGADTEVNTDKFRKIDEEDVPVDQVIFCSIDISSFYFLLIFSI